MPLALQRLLAVGGGSRSRYWLQLLATVLEMPVKFRQRVMSVRLSVLRGWR
ncbi:MAG: FGGY-family carbohydrate kinase [Thiolinea sp.]